MPRKSSKPTGRHTSRNSPKAAAQSGTLLADIVKEAIPNGTNLDSLFEVIPNPFFIKSREGRYLGCNSAFEEFLGLKREQILGKTAYDIAPKELADRYTAADEELFSNPGTQIYEAKVQWSDNSIRDVIFHKAVLAGPDGKISGLTGIIVDITERKQMEQTLRRQEQQYRTLVEHSPDLIVRYNSELQRIYVNPAWEKTSGLSADEVIGVPAPAIPKVPQPTVEKYLTALQDALENGNRHAVDFSWVNAHGKKLDLQYVVVPETDDEGNVISVLSVGRDVTEYKRAIDTMHKGERHLRNANRTLRTLSAGNEVLVRATSEQELLEQMCWVIVEIGGHLIASIGEMILEGGIVESRAWAGCANPDLRKCMETIAHKMYAEYPVRNSPLVVHDISSHPLFKGCAEKFQAVGAQSAIILPLQSETECLGVISIYSIDPAAFDEEEEVLLSELVDDLSYGIRAMRNRVAREDGLLRIQEIMEKTIQALASTIEFRDPYTAGHQRHVAQLAVAIGHELGLNSERITGLYLAATIHDIGKIKVPAEVLSRPAKLSEFEYELVKGHVEAGYNILKSINFPWPIAEIVQQHHERIDGSGYPHGIRGNEMLLESRILAVADTVEAISSHRPFRPARGIKRALEEIETAKGTLYDDSVVETCTRLFREKAFAFD